jgi:hypothetical protein
MKRDFIKSQYFKLLFAGEHRCQIKAIKPERKYKVLITELVKTD